VLDVKWPYTGVTVGRVVNQMMSECSGQNPEKNLPINSVEGLAKLMYQLKEVDNGYAVGQRVKISKSAQNLPNASLRGRTVEITDSGCAIAVNTMAVFIASKKTVAEISGKKNGLKSLNKK